LIIFHDKITVMPFFALIGQFVLSPFKFVGEVYQELQHVTWPSRKETVASTFVVIALCLIVGGWIGGLDFVFTNAVGAILK
jgi:preprotein translocase subunit SecE